MSIHLDLSYLTGAIRALAVLAGTCCACSRWGRGHDFISSMNPLLLTFLSLPSVSLFIIISSVHFLPFSETTQNDLLDDMLSDCSTTTTFAGKTTRSECFCLINKRVIYKKTSFKQESKSGSHKVVFVHLFYVLCQFYLSEGIIGLEQLGIGNLNICIITHF